MVYLYKSIEDINNKSQILMDNEAFFKTRITAKEFGKLENEVIFNIDKAELLDKNVGTIKTPYGICSIENLSTGCKTVINAIFLYKHRNQEPYCSLKYIYATECGYNALEELFRVVDENNYDIGIILEHSNELYNCSKRDYVVNNKKHLKSLIAY